MTKTTNENPVIDQRTLHRIGQVAIVLAITAAVIGFVIGLRQGVALDSSDDRAMPHASQTRDDHIPEAITYSELSARQLGPNANWKNVLPDGGADAQQLFEDIAYDPQQRIVALELRKLRRAYAGAPPVVPHDIDQLDASSCLACHEHGLKVGDVIAPPMSHEKYVNCFQCHVQSTESVVDESYAARTLNAFTSQDPPIEGERAWIGAPPVMPHTTWMRENCLSCHGPHGDPGLRTSHAWRTNCMQCHVPPADLNQVTTFFFQESESQ